MEKLGQRIRMVRQGESRASFSRRLGISPASLQRYELGERSPDKDFLERLISDKNLCREWLMLGAGPMFETLPGKGKNTDQTCDMSQVLQEQKTQLPETNDNIKNQTCDTSQVLELQSELLKASKEYAVLLSQNGDLRVEVERLRMELERRDRRIKELEKTYNEEHEELMLLKKTLSPTSPQPVQPVTEKELQH